MSYRNPIQHIDTQSGQHIRNMQQGLSDTSQKFFKSLDKEYENRVRLNELVNKDADDRTNAAEATMFDTEQKNSTIGFDDFNGEVTKMSNIIKTVSPEKRTLEQRNFIKNIERAGTFTRGVIENNMAGQADHFEMRNAGAGSQGGYAKDSPNLKALDIFYNYKDAPGSKEMRFKFDGPNGPVVWVDIYDEKGVKVGEVMNRNMDSVKSITKIPKENNAIATITNAGNKELNLGDDLSEAYPSKVEVKTIGGQEIKYRVPDKELWKNQVKKRMFARVASSSPASGMAAFFNDVIPDKNKGGNLEKITGVGFDWVGEDKDNPKLTRIMEAYLDFAADSNTGLNPLELSRTTIPTKDKTNKPPKLDIPKFAQSIVDRAFSNVAAELAQTGNKNLKLERGKIVEYGEVIVQVEEEEVDGKWIPAHEDTVIGEVDSYDPSDTIGAIKFLELVMDNRADLKGKSKEVNAIRQAIQDMSRNQTTTTYKKKVEAKKEADAKAAEMFKEEWNEKNPHKRGETNSERYLRFKADREKNRKG